MSCYVLEIEYRNILFLVSDTLYLLLNGYSVALIKEFLEMKNLGFAECTIVRFLGYWLPILSPWILAGITVERMLAILVPHKIKLLATPKLHMCIF